MIRAFSILRFFPFPKFSKLPQHQFCRTPNTIFMERFNELRAMVEAIEADAAKFFDKGNKAAGTRVRKAMQELKNTAQEIRAEVQKIKNEG